MDVSEMLARIEKLPGEWRHPQAGRWTYEQTAWTPDIQETMQSIALDLHLRHIAEKLMVEGIHLEMAGPEQFWCSLNNEIYSPYAAALLSAAEEAAKMKGRG